MSDIKLELDDGGLLAMFKEYAELISKDLDQGLKTLAVATHTHITELAQKELKTSRKQFMENLTWSEIAPGVYAVTIHAPAVWIDNGFPSSFDMKPGLLKDAKVSKDGVRYKVIPMDKGAPPTQLDDSGKHTLEMLKKGLKDKKVPLRKLEFNPDGSPKLGKIHSFDFGGKIPGKGVTPILDRVNIYQHQNSKTGKVTRQITTFRTVTDGKSQEGKWVHPSLEGKHFLDRAVIFADQHWTNNILPEILRRYTGE